METFYELEKDPSNQRCRVNVEDSQTKGRDDKICQETLQETSDGESRFQMNLEQPR